MDKMADDDKQMTKSFQREMISIGILSYKEQETLWDIGKRCSRTLGVVTAGTGAVMGSAGFVPGALAGFLGGLVVGTATCTALNVTYRKQVRQFLDEQ